MDLLRKVFCFKIKGINLKTTKHKKQNTKQKKKTKTKSQSEIFDNRANSSGENGSQSSLFYEDL